MLVCGIVSPLAAHFMFSLSKNNATAKSDQLRSVRILIFGRMAAILLLLGSAYIWYGERFTADDSRMTLPLVAGGAIAAAAIYLSLLSIFGKTRWQIWVQFLIDAFFVSWLVQETGGIGSPYITLYIVLIAVSSLFLRPLSTLLMAVVCVFLFVSTTSAAAFGLFGSPVGGTSRLFQNLSFHTVAILVVGLLAARLSERRSSGDQLKETAKDLATLRALHERIIESIRSGLITTDMAGSIFTFNKAAAEITGRPIEEMSGRNITEVIRSFNTSVELIKTSPDGEQAMRFEDDLATPQGFAVRIGYSIAKLYSESNELSGWIVTFQDLTEIRLMEESIRRKDRLAAVGRVGAGLAHEIRNPLGAMRGAIQVLQSATPPESMQADLMGIILRESDRLNSIITNFLSYAKPKVGNFSDVDVCEAIRDTATLLRHSPDLLPGHDIVEKMPSTPVFISADATQLKQIFWNLARNAVQAMPDGGRLLIKLEAVTAGRLRIIFEDTGRGMPPEQVEQLFEPFSPSTSGGTGLGLSIVYQIIRDHNGTINVRSVEGKGTVITVDLPRQQTSVQPSAAETRANRLSDFLNVKSGDE